MEQTQPSDGYRELGIRGPGARLAGVSIGLQVVVWVAIIVRFYSRSMTRGGTGLDDWIILAAGIVNVPMNAFTITAVYFGYGSPGATLLPPHRVVALQMFWLTQIVYKIVMGLCKLGYLAFYLRIFPRHDSIWRKTIFITVWIVAGYSLASIIATVVQCAPIARVWDKSIAGSCIDLTAFWYTNAAYNILTDVVIMVIPLCKINSLKLRRLRDKVGLFGIFTVGIFVIATSIVRVTTLNPSSKSIDQTSGTLDSTIWTTVEGCMAIICSCLPAFRTPIVRLYRCFYPKPDISSHYTESGASGRNARPMEEVVGLNDIGVRTDVKVDFGERSRESSLTTHHPSHSVVISARELA